MKDQSETEIEEKEDEEKTTKEKSVYVKILSTVCGDRTVTANICSHNNKRIRVFMFFFYVPLRLKSFLFDTFALSPPYVTYSLNPDGCFVNAVKLTAYDTDSKTATATPITFVCYFFLT